MKRGADDESLIRLWRTRMMSSKARYDLAATRVKVARADLRSGSVPAPDGDYAFRQALAEERAAIREYSTALKICYDLIMEGKAPDEEVWREAKGQDMEPQNGG